MKKGKKPTREQRKLIEKNRLNGEAWYVSKDTPVSMELISRSDNKIIMTIDK